ncbi:MAG: hypothetical protein POH28_13530 [Acidocella sp.]|nr:hypothetical protein [Acidocella sp.]
MSSKKTMRHKPDFDYPIMPPLSDEAAVKILDFLQGVMNDFENRYFAQIQRYYDERSRHNLIQASLFEEAGDDPPF